MSTAPSRPRRRGPRPSTDPGTRETIAAAARAEFAERGFAGATIRSIAARAGVDPALVHHYFGTKMELFAEVLRRGFEPALQALPDALSGPRPELGRRLATMMVLLYEDPGFREPLLATMGTALTDPRVAAMVSDHLKQVLLPQLTSVVVGPDAPRRAALAMGTLTGTMLGRHLLALDGLTGPTDALIDELAPVIQRYLDGPAA